MSRSKLYLMTLVLAVSLCALAPSALAYDYATNLTVGSKIGVGVETPVPGGLTGIHVRGGGNPGFTLQQDGTTSFMQVYADTSIGYFLKRNYTGLARLWFNVQPQDGVSEAQVQFFRTTNTTGIKGVNLCKGNNTATIDTRLAVDGGVSYISTGNVGIGTKTPTAKLDVTGDIKASTIIRAGTDVSCAVLEIRGSGNDLAEAFKVNAVANAVKPGMVVSIDPDHAGDMMLASVPYDRKVAGIISGAGDLHAGIHLGDAPTASDGKQSIALTGRVWCLADASNGKIMPGDSLTTSSIPGHAIKVRDFARAQGAIIGKAMTGLDAGSGSVLVLVNLH